MVSSPAYSGHKAPYTTYGQDESNDERQRRRQKYQNRQSELRRSEIRQSELRHEVLDIARSLRVSLRSDSASRSMLQDPASAVLPEPPRYGDLSHYAIRDDDEKCLWELEVTRLIDSLGTAQEPLSTSHGNVLTSAVDTSAFNSLGRLSDQMICALSIYGMDDTVATATSPIDSVGGRSYNRLQERLGQRPELAHVVGVRDPLVTRFRHSERHSRIPRPPMQQETQVQGDPVPLESLNDDDAPTYYALVDYITTILVRLLLKGCDRRHVYWLSIVLTTLAKISTKLKVLSHDLPIFVEQSLDRFSLHNHNYLDALEQTAENPHVDPPLLRQEMKDVTTGIKDNYIVNYVSDMTAVSNWLFRLIWHILTDLNTRNTRGRTTDEFDISASVLTLGSRSLPTLAYQNRPGHISGSSSIVALEMYQRAFDLMIDTVKGIRWNSVPIEQVTKGQCTLSIGVDRALPNQSSEIKSMTEIVSIMVLVSCMDPSLTEDMVKVCSTVRASNVLPKVSNTVQKYAAFFSFRNVPVESNLQPLQNSRPLSQSFILKSGNVPISVVPDRDNAPSRWEFSEAAQKDLHKSESMRRHVSLSARGWAVDEQAISVSCLKYTVSIMVGCSILVLGGLMAGLFVGSRIDGVDPFNLTMFAWIIAGFIILVSKSLRVGEWNWRDFLKGRVTCRTVHELASVTNLDEQGIIMQLLSSEKEWPFISRGPYNSAFSNTGADGFSVDVKPKIGTLFVSGLLVLEVLMESGPALVCLDIRPHITAGENNEATEGAHRGDIPVQVSRNRMVHAQRVPLYALACKDVPQQDEAEKDIVFRQQWVTWEKIIGLYNNTKQSVR